MKLTIGKLTVEVPGLMDAEAAQRAAAEVTRRIDQAESESSRIDTLAFALIAAHSLAMELQELQDARGGDVTELAKGLQSLSDTLSNLLDEYELED